MLQLARSSGGRLIYLYEGRVYDAISLDRIDLLLDRAKILIETWNECHFMSEPVYVRMKEDFGIFTTGEQLGIVDMFPVDDRDDLLSSTDPVLEVVPFKLCNYYRLPAGPDSLPPANESAFHELWLAALRDCQKTGKGISEIDQPRIEVDD